MGRLFDDNDTRIGVAIFGSTGSIGTQTLDVISRFRDTYKVIGLTARSSATTMIEQIRQFRPVVSIMEDTEAYEQVKEAIGDEEVHPKDYTYVLPQQHANTSDKHDELERLASDNGVDIVIAAMVGFAGLRPTIAAIKAGKKVCIANKETFVVAGELINALAKKSGAQIVPIDSEHSAIAQCLVGEKHESIKRIILTASGGPFRTLAKGSFKDITLEQALKHPNWVMGRKITIDSATLMNKGLEVIEARWLFDVPLEKVDVIVHPQSIIHSMVEFVDGSVKAQLGAPDMRLPIQYALGYPERLPQEYDILDLLKNNRFDFEEPDTERFPCLELARKALRRGGLYPCILNAANEVAVEAFLEEKLRFIDIPTVIDSVMDSASSGSGEPFDASSDESIEKGLLRIYESDKAARVAAKQLIAKLSIV
jgi:1-deoxy-D-xylulose-5-phosphate reductoisomerase